MPSTPLEVRWPQIQCAQFAQIFRPHTSEFIQQLRELEPGLTASVLQARYPGRDSPHAGRFIGALVEAGLPR